MEIQDLDSQMKSSQKEKEKEKESEIRSKSISNIGDSAHKRGGSFEIATTSSFGKLET